MLDPLAVLACQVLGACIMLDTYNYYLQPPSIQAVKENINNILYSVYVQSSSSVQFRHFHHPVGT